MRTLQPVDTLMIETLAAWWGLDGRPGSRVLHVWLYEVLRLRAVELRNLLRKSVGEQWVVGLESEILGRVGRPEELPALFSKRLTRGLTTGDAALAEAAAMLRAVDHLHGLEAPHHHGLVVDLPAGLGGGQALLLGPAPDGLETLASSDRQLVRGQRHRTHVVRELLGLSFHVRRDDSAHRVRVHRLPGLVGATLRRALRREQLRIGVASGPVVRYAVTRHEQDATEHFGVPFWLDGVDERDRAAAEQQLDAAVVAAREARVSLLLFPELTLDDRLLVRLQAKLGEAPGGLPALVVAGSFHRQIEGVPRNRCTVLDGGGEVLWVQDKQVPYELPADQAASVGVHGRGAVEAIEACDTLVVVDGPLGRMSSPICLDFCGTWLRELFVELGVNLLLVPAATPRTDDFVQRARELGTDARTTTIVANAAWLLALAGRDQEAAALLYMPLQEALWRRIARRGGAFDVFNIHELLEGGAELT